MPKADEPLAQEADLPSDENQGFFLMELYKEKGRTCIAEVRLY